MLSCIIQYHRFNAFGFNFLSMPTRVGPQITRHGLILNLKKCDLVLRAVHLLAFN